MPNGVWIRRLKTGSLLYVCFTSLPWSTLTEHVISQQQSPVCVTLLYALYIHFFTVACWEAPLPSGCLSQRKPNGGRWRREKISLFTSPQRTFLSDPSVVTFAYEPVSLTSSAAMRYFSATDSWHVSVCFTLWTHMSDMSVCSTHNKNYLQLLFTQSVF